MKQKIGTFNCRGILTSKVKQQMLANDFEKYNMTTLAVQETHMKGYGTMTLTSKNGKNYTLYYSGHETKSENGVGIILPSSINAEFQPVCDRICKVRININSDLKVDIISVYAPTLDKSEKHPEQRENFYTKLDSVLQTISNRNIVIVIGDFNAKTGSATHNEIYHPIIGKYGKGQLNNNGKHLLNFASSNNLKLVNTFFKHKSAHRTTWTSPETPRGNRRNFYRNQIDYILVRKNRAIRVDNARSYGGMTTPSDHKLVMMTCIMKRPYIPKKKYNPQINIENLKGAVADQYRNILDEKLRNIPDSNNDIKWKQIAEVMNETALSVLGKKPKHRYNVSEEIAQLSEKQKSIRLNIENCLDENRRQRLRRERNEIMREIHQKMKKHEEKRIESKLRDIESSKNDSSRMFRAIKEIQRNKPKPSLLIKTVNGGYTINEKEQSEIIATYFKNQFYKNTPPSNTNVEPVQMLQPFTATEVEKAIKKLRNNRSAGDDGIKAEMLKFAPNILHELIAEIYNKISETGEYPSELTLGTVIPIQKPGKQKGPVKNLRPITLLSMVRKILAICMKERIADRLNAEIPPSQAAYRAGRSTTEHVFAAKILNEKATSSTNYRIHLLMLDMSKAFDTVNREKLLKELSKCLSQDELHIIKVLLNTQLQIRCGNEKSDKFVTDTGVPQGDCLSANFFTYYLAKALTNEEHNDHDYCNDIAKPPAHIEYDHAYAYKNEEININMEYADDMNQISTDLRNIEHAKKSLPTKLGQWDLVINEDKTEQYTIMRNGDENWKKCKLLGTLLDTEEDIKRRKVLAMNAITSMKDIFFGNISMEVKIRAFDCYISSIFLYNCETWTLTKSLLDSIDAFHRRLLRIACINVRWPNIATNEDVYNITRQIPWSQVITRRELSWLGHLFRLPDDVPAKIALQHSLRPTKKPRGRQKSTWITMMINKIRGMGLDWEEAAHLAMDRLAWNNFMEQWCPMRSLYAN